jgi:hypothetical protein
MRPSPFRPFVLVLAAAAIGCFAPVVENPAIDPIENATCGPSARLVRDVCTKLGPDDSCVAVDDVCIALCDDVAACLEVSAELRAVSPWPVAPDGYCVVCLQPGP